MSNRLITTRHYIIKVCFTYFNSHFSLKYMQPQTIFGKRRQEMSASQPQLLPASARQDLATQKVSFRLVFFGVEGRPKYMECPCLTFVKTSQLKKNCVCFWGGVFFNAFLFHRTKRWRKAPNLSRTRPHQSCVCL